MGEGEGREGTYSWRVGGRRVRGGNVGAMGAVMERFCIMLLVRYAYSVFCETGRLLVV